VKYLTGTLLFYRLTRTTLMVIMMVLAVKADVSFVVVWIPRIPLCPPEYKPNWLFKPAAVVGVILIKNTRRRLIINGRKIFWR
jgi:hypothetical protein